MNRVIGSVSRPLALAIALSLPGSALAVGLGEARVDSYLNQPLDVRMRLLDATVDELDSLTVGPASPEEFERLGLMSGALALGLEISVDRSQPTPVVRVRSTRPVSDPVVQLLIDARWSGGRMLREYTLFLDPSTVPVAPPPAQTASREAPSAETDVGESRPASVSRARPEPRSAEPLARARVSGRYGPVTNGETLWSIARSALPAGDITMDQMMLAIVELNPNAFRDGNINLLLRGAELELPTAEQARAMDAATAAAVAAEQNRAFAAGIAAVLPVVSDAARGQSAGDDERPRIPDREPADATVASRDPQDHRLELVPPDDEQGGSGLSDDAAEVATLRQQLARTEEELYAARQEADEFRERLTELETLIDQRDGAMGLQDAELASLEQTLRDAREATREDADPALRAQVSERLDQYISDFADPDASIAEEDSGDPAADGASASEPDRIADADAADPTVVEATEAAAAPPSEPVITEVAGGRSWFGFKPWVVLSALGVIVLALLGLLGRFLSRRGADSTEPEPSVPAKPAPGPAAPSDPSESARAAVAVRPDDLTAHVALLQALSAQADEGQFGDALENMFEHVESGKEPEWREALELAERIVPGHALVKGSSDWVADEKFAGEAELQTELDREVEVDDLMSRLDADMDESDDSDWLRSGDDDDRGLEEDESESGPLLRGEDQPTEPRATTETDDDDMDFGDWLNEGLSGAERESGSKPDSGAVRDDESTDDELTLEWSDSDGPAPGEFEMPIEQPDRSADDQAPDLGAAGADEDRPVGDDPAADEIGELVDEPANETSGAADDSSDGAAETEGDVDDEGDSIFSQGEDDVEVKLDLARAYVSWNSTDSARTLLEEILREGNDEQQAEARKLLDGMSGSDDG